MKTIILLAFYLTLLYSIQAFSQSNLSMHLNKRYGGSSGEGVGAMIRTSDSGLLIGGFSDSGISGDKSDTCRGYWDYWIVKIDSLGTKQWDKTFGGTQSERLHSLNQTSDGGYIIGGTSPSGIGGDKTEPSWGFEDFWIIKTDSLGNKLWDKRFGGTGHDYLAQVNQTDDGGYLCSGYSDSPISGNKTQANWGANDFWIIKIDSTGNYMWDKRYGGTGEDGGGLLGGSWVGSAIFAKSNDGGYLVGGASRSGISGDKTYANWSIYSDFWILKIDSAGNKLWDKVYGGTKSESLIKIKQTFDGGYILGGGSSSDISGNKTSANCHDFFGATGDYWLVKIDSIGNIQWDQDYGSDDGDAFTDVYQTPDGGYLVSGTTDGGNVSCQKSEDYMWFPNAWIVKTNSLGIKEWDKSIFGPDISNSTCVALPINNDCYAIASGSYWYNMGYNTQQSCCGFDYWLLKFCNCSPADLPNAAIGLAGYGTEICPTQCIGLVDVSDCYTSREWLFPGGTPSSSTQQIQWICYQDSGYYPVTLISTNANGTDTLTIPNYIHVFPAQSQPVIIQFYDTLTSSPAAVYQWYEWDGFSENQIVGATNQTFIADSSDYYFVCVENSYGCDSCSDPFYYDITGIKFHEGNIQSTIKIIPNPAHKIFTLYLDNQPSSFNGLVEIYNVLGKRVYTEKMISPLRITLTDDFLPGIYLVKVTAREKQYIKKLIVQ